MKKVILALTILATTSNALADSMIRNDQSSSQLTIDREKLNQGEQQRRQDILKSLEEMSKRYQVVLAQLPEAKEKIKQAKELCEQKCTGIEVRTLLGEVKWYSSWILGGTIAVNFVRVLAKEPLGSISFATPWKTITGNMMLISATVDVLAFMTTNVLDERDEKLKATIVQYEKHLALLENQITSINSQISRLNEALTKTIQINEEINNTRKLTIERN